MLPSLNELIKKFDEFDDKQRLINVIHQPTQLKPMNINECYPSQREPHTIHSSYYSSTTCNNILSSSNDQYIRHHERLQHSSQCKDLAPVDVKPLQHSNIRSHQLQTSTMHVGNQPKPPHFHHTPLIIPQHSHVEISTPQHAFSHHSIERRPSISISSSTNHHVTTCNFPTELQGNNIHSYNQNIPNISSSNSPNNSSAQSSSTNSFQSMSSTFNVNKKIPKNKISKKSKEPIQFKAFSLSLDTSKIKFINEQHQKIGINDGSWTEKEHADFIRGLNECGKGKWREISEGYVKTRTRTQVASHARKYLEMLARKNKSPSIK